MAQKKQTHKGKTTERSKVTYSPTNCSRSRQTSTLNMGSRFSVLNDTQHKVWIKHGINWKVLTAVFRGIAFLFNKGMACAATRSSNKVEPEERITNDVVTAGDESLRNASEAAEKVQDDDEGFKADAELIEPGEKYTFSGTLSLTMTVYVMNDKQQVDRRACFTGPTHDSENRYPISQYFPKLAVN